MLPYGRAHDVDDPGLRDYRASVAHRVPSWPWWLLAVALAISVVLTATLRGDGCVTLQVRPIVMLQRADIQISTSIPRHADHRAYVLIWTSDVGVGGRQVRQLDGERAELLHTQRLRDMPPARYRFAAMVYGPGGLMLGLDRAEIHTTDPGREKPTR